MEQRVLLAFLHPGRAANDDHRRFLGKCLGGGVRHLQPADAIRDAHRPQTPHPRIGIRRKPGALLVARVDDAQLAPRKQVIEAQHVIARYAEHMTHAIRVKLFDEVFANGRSIFHPANQT